jgi:3-oxoacyl-[acyl-carrier-protein] synthase III
VVWGSVPEMSDAVRIMGRDGTSGQEGQTVFRWTTTELPRIAIQVCERSGVRPEDLGAVVLHQASLRIIEPLANRIGAVNAVVARDVVDSGNTSAASSPLALSKLVERGEIPSGAPGASVRIRRWPGVLGTDHPLPLTCGRSSFQRGAVPSHG